MGIYIGNGEAWKDFNIEIMKMYTTCTLMQQNKKLKKDVDFPILGTSHEKVKSKMHKFNSRNARIPGSA
jgi:predicted nucleotidyltransferase